MTEPCGSKLEPALGALRQSRADFCLTPTLLAAIATAVGIARASRRAGWRGSGPGFKIHRGVGWWLMEGGGMAWVHGMAWMVWFGLDARLRAQELLH